jgi:hypothetical protein
MSDQRFCMHGHELVPGETAYVATRWRGREIFLPARGGLLEACAAGDLHGTTCKYGGLEDHARLERSTGAGGTRVVGSTEDGRTLWQHRVFELRCRACNRERVARYRQRKKESVMGGGTGTNYSRLK